MGTKTQTTIKIGAATGHAYSDDRAESAQLYVLERSNDPREQRLAELRLGAIRGRRATTEARKAAREAQEPTPLAPLTKRDPVRHLSAGHRAVAELLREHLRGDVVRVPQDWLGTYVEGGSSALTGPEAATDSRFRGRVAMDRFDEGCGSQEMAVQCRLILSHRRSFRACCEALGIGTGGDGKGRVRRALCLGLEEAGAYLGVGS